MGQEGFESMWAGVLLLVLGAASIVALTVTGLVIAKLETGRINVIDVVKEATLRGTAKTVLRRPGSFFDYLLSFHFFTGFILVYVI